MVEGPRYHTLHSPKLSTSTWRISHADEFSQHIMLLSESSPHQQLLHLQLSDDLH